MNAHTIAIQLILILLRLGAPFTRADWLITNACEGTRFGVLPMEPTEQVMAIQSSIAQERRQLNALVMSLKYDVKERLVRWQEQVASQRQDIALLLSQQRQQYLANG